VKVDWIYQMVVGPQGINHGVELYPEVVEYAYQCLDAFRTHNDRFDEFDFCEPSFTVGNCLLIPSGSRLYDRVYCGAACPEEHENYMKNLLRVDGVLVMPVNDQVIGAVMFTYLPQSFQIACFCFSCRSLLKPLHTVAAYSSYEKKCNRVG
jgi:hypothetical protein